MFTNEKIPSNCHDYKHDSKFWNLSRDQKKFESTWKKKRESSKRIRSPVKLPIDVSTQGFDPKWRFVGFEISQIFSFLLARLIASYDSIEFLVRRLDEYERTLATLTSRFYETYSCLPAHQNTVTDLSNLCNCVAFLCSHFQRSLDCDNNSVVVSTTGNIHPLQIEHCNRPGRPRLAITQG